MKRASSTLLGAGLALLLAGQALGQTSTILRKPDNSAAVDPANAGNQITANTALGTLHTDNGAPGSGITPPTGASGILGWLSGIYKAVTGTLTTKAVDSGGADATDTTNHALRVNCVVNCAGGSTSNASSGVATSSTNGQTVAFLYVWNGTTWDQFNPLTATPVTQSGTWATNDTPQSSAASSAAVPVTQSSTSASTSLIAKASPGNVYGYDCNTATASTKCILYDQATVPGAGALTATKVIGCFDVTTGHAPVAWSMPRSMANGAVVLLSTGTDCLTYTASSTGMLFAAVK